MVEKIKVYLLFQSPNILSTSDSASIFISIVFSQLISSLQKLSEYSHFNSRCSIDSIYFLQKVHSDEGTRPILWRKLVCR